MTNTAEATGRTKGLKPSPQATYMVLFLFATIFLIQSCKLDAPVFPDKPVITKPGDTTKTDTTHTTPPPVTNPIDTVITDTITPATANFNRLVNWEAYKANPAGGYNMLLIGDSYTQGNFFTWRLREKLLTSGFNDGGPGYDSFGRYDPLDISSIDASVEADELTFTYDPLVWDTSPGNYYGPCGNVSNTTADALITVKSAVPLNTMTIIYERQPDAGDFRYRVNFGAWTTLSANNATEDIGSIVVDVSKMGKTINLDIQALKEGQTFCGVLGRRSGDLLTLHKMGSAGTTAGYFAANNLWEESVKLLAPKGAVIFFGINEMNRNIAPAEMRVNVQHIIDRLRHIKSNCDIMIICPPETVFEKEDPREYKTAQYADMLFKLALANRAAFIDFAKIFPPFSTTSINLGLISNDRIHPAENGSELIAETIFNGLKK